MKTVLRLIAGSILAFGIIAAFATYPDGRTFLVADYPRAIPVWIWCALISSAAASYLLVPRYLTAMSGQVRAAAATAIVIGTGVVLYSYDVRHIWTELVLKFI